MIAVSKGNCNVYANNKQYIGLETNKYLCANSKSRTYGIYAVKPNKNRQSNFVYFTINNISSFQSKIAYIWTSDSRIGLQCLSFLYEGRCPDMPEGSPDAPLEMDEHRIATAL